MARVKDQASGWKWNSGVNPETSNNPFVVGLHNKEMPKEGNFDVKRDYGGKANFSKTMKSEGQRIIEERNAAAKPSPTVAEKPTGAEQPSQLGTSDKPAVERPQSAQTYELSNNQKQSRLKPAAGSYRPPEAQKNKDTLG